MNTFKKYTAGVFCIESTNPDLNHGDTLTIATRHGKEVECTIWKKLFTKGELTYYSYTRADGFNRSEWMRRKAERASGAAQRQEQLSDAYYTKSNKDRDFLSLAEPIKVGHHSEKRHRKIIDQANSNMGKCVEASRKATAYTDKAQTLEYQAENQINIDNPDCLEQLQAKVDKLEAQRAALKASGKYESWQLSNLAGNIKRYRDRLETARKLWDVDYTPTPKVSTNADRAERARTMLKAYPSDGYKVDIEQAGEELIIDAITDLGHYCDEAGIDFEACLSMAKTHIEAERKGE